MNDKRRYERTTFRARVKIIHPDVEDESFETRDLSQGGVFLFTGGRVKLPVGTELTVRDDEILLEPPLVKARIVRVDDQGIALMFLEE